MIRSALLVGYDHFVIGSICVYVFYRFFPPDFQFNFETTEAHTRFWIVGGRGGYGKVMLRAHTARSWVSFDSPAHAQHQLEGNVDGLERRGAGGRA